MNATISHPASDQQRNTIVLAEPKEVRRIEKPSHLMIENEILSLMEAFQTESMAVIEI